MEGISKAQLLSVIEDVIRTMPHSEMLHVNFQWIGRASAAMREWDEVRAGVQFQSNVNHLLGTSVNLRTAAVHGIAIMLHTARQELLLQLDGPLSISVHTGNRFDYFNEVRKIIEMANNDIFFIDPYLDVEFVNTYLPQVKKGISIRLLADRYVAKLVPAAKLFTQQNGTNIDVRSSQGFHDRYVIIDRQACYQSGASFKDGAKNAPALISQVTDAFTATSQIYEALWAAATTYP